MSCDKFLVDIQDFIQKSIKNDTHRNKKNSLNCNNSFNCNDKYLEEKEILKRIRDKNYKTTTEQGNLLEELVKKLFNRISLISSLSVTNRDTALGQIDINLIPIDTTIYDIWGLVGDYPEALTGECKNYKSDKVGRPEIEKTCWRAGKGTALSFFFAASYTQDALQEIAYFNLHKRSIFKKSQGVYIVPITLEMLDVVISNHLNFCYFIRWAIESSKKMKISNYL
jgi:hypothetical protein